jgi:hypothetical protein
MERGEDGFADGFAVFEDVRVPEAQDRITLRLHVFIADAITWVVGMLATVDFDDEPVFTTGKIRKIWTYGQLARKPKPAQLSVL